MRKPPENSRRCCCARPGPASKAAPTRSCATSSPSACSVCPAISGSTRTCRSTRYRPRDEIEGSDLRGLERNARLLKRERLAMNFDDTPQEAAFRATAREWIDANAPKELEAE